MHAPRVMDLHDEMRPRYSVETGPRYAVVPHGVLPPPAPPGPAVLSGAAQPCHRVGISTVPPPGGKRAVSPVRAPLCSDAYACGTVRSLSGLDQVIDASCGTPLNQELKYAPEVFAPTVHLSVLICHAHVPHEAM
ncbi:hypothetical protein Smic_03420 [Streptomyces microflavus]|uniref:Uncharacterized protein n=1 Tax=Streptomyces microflavus TaxID=1919 RepID=A0A7J0CH39_STRMI|nr:hypothetical protein Smic_03420 [Streptomyces microflavus]